MFVKMFKYIFVIYISDQTMMYNNENEDICWPEYIHIRMDLRSARTPLPHNLCIPPLQASCRLVRV